MLYTDFKVKIQNNGYLSEDINIERSVHQGGCCSSYIFLCCAEIMATAIRNNSNICGVLINEIEYLLNQFADDTDITSLFDQLSLNSIMEELENFRDMSGFTISYDKTAILRVGNVTTFDSVPCRIGAGLTQCTFYRLKQRETQQNDLIRLLQPHTSHIYSQRYHSSL